MGSRLQKRLPTTGDLGTKNNPRSLDFMAMNACREILNYGGCIKVILGSYKSGIVLIPVV